MEQRHKAAKIFTSHEKAMKFVQWIKNHPADYDVGAPYIEDVSEAVHGLWTVEYNVRGRFVDGVAEGIEFA